MIKNILHTIFTKFSSAALGFLTIILISQILGAEAKGEQAIMVYNINLMLMFFTLIGNSTLIYLVPRKDFSSLIIPSLIWVLFSAIIAAIVFIFVLKSGVFYSIICIIIAILAALSEINQFLLLGKQKITQANTLKFLYPLISFSFILVLWLFDRFTKVEDFILAMFIAYFISLFYGLFALKDEYKNIKLLSKKELTSSFKTLFSLGVTKQTGYIAQSMNYRLCFYILGFYCGETLVGIYSNAVSLSEAVMLFGSSLALVQYSSLSNNENDSSSKQFSWKMSKINGIFTALALLVLCLLPSEVYSFVFGKGFSEISTAIRILSIGILPLSIASNFTQYFYAKGNFKISTVASLIGLAVTIIAGLILIPKYQLQGAALSATLSYFTTFAIEFYFFALKK
ncbi:MAG: polysaccharide biosynthesis C-terminal domain-containing protein [Bacteroidales bacterium]|nr:polysaccharide biosynthesis C-terminal domain-containing protein [Bacteroidales bacterium]